MSNLGDSRYEAIVVGSGQGGTPLARALAGAGRRTALIERRYVGGTCVNDGCTPTKTMVGSAKVASMARRATEYGVAAGVVSVTLSEVVRRKDSVVASFRDGSERGIAETRGLDLVFGDARFTGPRRLEVARRDGSTLSLEADQIFLDVGCRPGRPPIEGLETVPALDSTSIQSLRDLPESLLIVGGGYIGVEFGQMFRRFGSRVAIVHRGARLLAREDADVASAVAEVLREEGVELHLESEPARVERHEEGVELTVRRAGVEVRLTGSHLLVATGRVPNTDTLDLPAAGVAASDRGFVVVNERLETTAPGVYCLGDANGGPAFTHVSYDDFRVVRRNLLEGGRATTAGRMVPYTVFLDPELGRVGLTEEQAAAEGRKVRVAKLPMTKVARAIEMGETRGFLKAVVDEGTGQILGCAILGTFGGELMAMIQIAMMGKVPWTDLREGIFAHPTLAESLNNLFLTLHE